MARPIRIRMALFVFTILQLVLCGCGSSPSYRFYTLSSPAIPESAPQGLPGEKPSIVLIGPISIPDYLDRPQIVTRNEEGRLVLHEYDQWGGSLKTDVLRVTLENLTALLAQDNISPLTWRTNVADVYRVPITLYRLDAMPGKQVSLEAQWGIISKDKKSVEFNRQTKITAPLAATDCNGIVAAMSAALTDFSKDVAAAIKSVLEANRKAVPGAPEKPSQ